MNLIMKIAFQLFAAVALFQCITAAPIVIQARQNPPPLQVTSNGVPKIGATDLFAFHRSLMNINSTSGNETLASDFLSTFLKDLGWTVELQPVTNPKYPGLRRENVYAYVGNNRNTSLLFCSHLDTVPPFIPFSEDGDNVYGRGANDAKGQIVAQIVAAEHLRSSGVLKEGQLGLLYTVGEETGGDGITAASDTGLNPTYMLIGEPTESYQASGHKGGLRLVIDAIGKFAHGSVPEVGKNAIYILIDAINKLREIAPSLPSGDFWGKTSLSVNIAQGGIVSNQVPDHASATVDIRTAVLNTSEVTSYILNNLSTLPDINITAPLSVTPIKFDLIKNWRETKVMTYGTDYLRWKGRGFRFLLGPGSITTAHTDHEMISKKELKDAVRYYLEFVSGILDGSFVVDNVGTFPVTS